MIDEEEDIAAEPTVEEQVALMYLGTVDEAKAQTIARRIVGALKADGEEAPRNADVFYSLLTAQTTLMARMGGTVPFRQTILRGFGAISAGQLAMMLAPKPKSKKPKPKPKQKAAEPEDEEPEERGPPRPYTEKASNDLDLYTVDEFRQHASTLDDNDGYAYQACKLGSGLVYYAPDKRYQVRPSDFAGPDVPRMLPGTSHIAWMTR